MSGHAAPQATIQNSRQGTILSVLMAYDGSEQAQAAVALAENLFGGCAVGQACRLTAITVLPTQGFQRHEQLALALDRVKHELESRGIPVEVILKTGNPAASLITYAEENHADLIIMGAQGLRATFGILLGGVAQQVVEYAHIPVLVVRPPYQGIRHVLVVTDGSEHSQRAIDYLAPRCPDENIEHRKPIHGQPKSAAPEHSAHSRCSWLPGDANVTVMHVLPPAISEELAARAWTLGPEVLYPAPITPVDWKALQEEEEKRGAVVLDEARAEFEASGLLVRTLMRRGDAATEILSLAREEQIDMIVCGSRGLNPVSGWLLGSVSRKLVHYAPCSVLIVK